MHLETARLAIADTTRYLPELSLKIHFYRDIKLSLIIGSKERDEMIYYRREFRMFAFEPPRGFFLSTANLVRFTVAKIKTPPSEGCRGRGRSNQKSVSQSAPCQKGNHAEAFHHHGTSGGWPKAPSGPRKSLCLMAEQAQKIALHATGALPPTTKTLPRIAIAVSCFSRPSFLLRWGLLYPVAIPPASWSSPQRHRS